MKRHKVDVHELSEDDPLSQSLVYLVLHAMGEGARTPGDKMTVIFPDSMLGHSRDEIVQTGEWEIVLTKMED